MTKPLTIISKSRNSNAFHKLLCDAISARGDDPSECNIQITFLASRFVSFKAAQDDIDVNGETIIQQGDKYQDRKIQNPMGYVRDKAYKDIFEGLKELGLTPKSKAALQLENAEAKQKREELLRAMQSQPQLGEDDL